MSRLYSKKRTSTYFLATINHEVVVVVYSKSPAKNISVRVFYRKQISGSSFLVFLFYSFDIPRLNKMTFVCRLLLLLATLFHNTLVPFFLCPHRNSFNNSKYLSVFYVWRVIKSRIKLCCCSLYCQRRNYLLIYIYRYLFQAMPNIWFVFVFVYLGGTQNFRLPFVPFFFFCCVRFYSERDTHHFVWCVLVCKTIRH